MVCLLLSLTLILSVQSTWADKMGSVTVVGLTEAGRNVVIELTDLSADKSAVIVTFDEVQTAGITRLKKIDAGTFPPISDFKLRTQPLYYSIATSAEYRNDVKICIDYSGKDIMKEGALRLHHLKNGIWEELETDLDHKNNIICGITSTLSDFVLFEDPRYVYGPMVWYQSNHVHR